jgi:hypothetical protein
MEPRRRYLLRVSGGVTEAVYVSVFDDYLACRSRCLFDPETMRVYQIAPALNAEDAENANALTDEYVLVDGTELRADDGVKFDY